MEISENALIKKLKRFEKRDPRVIRGIGDDGAVIAMRGGQYVLVQDAMVEHVHFEFSFLNPYYVGKKAVQVNISDVLSMGAMPLYFLVTIGLPAGIRSQDIERLYRGMRDASKQLNMNLLGGDTVSSQTFFIDISMVGKLVAGAYFGRDKARDGDLIGVTGYLGEAAYGLQLLVEKDAQTKGAARCIKRFMDPVSPYTFWKELMKHDITVAMMDISDGLIIDLERMMLESNKAARIHLESVPVPQLLRKNGMEELALTGGEDYQFLFTFSPTKLARMKALKDKGHMVSIIGEVTGGRGVRVFREGKEVRLKRKGYQHFNGTSHG
ncbi:MAG TPA: thiamine-phosphate kinase [Syntrophorhabdaceae bacterium]|nr:thiamine-phosphate kinase [Syntrophorhabdaceae bacterium]